MPDNDPTDHLRGPYKLYYGRPCALYPYDYDLDDPCTPNDFMAVFESEPEYLQRLELLTPEEEAALDAMTDEELAEVGED